MIRSHFVIASFLAFSTLSASAHAVSSAELYTNQSYQYGRVSARIQFAPGDGVVSSFFLWKNGSEVSGTFWNELDIEKLGADCHIETNAYFGLPAGVHSQKHSLATDLCSAFHTYTYEWTPDYIAWSVDDVEIRRDEGATATAYSENATAGMQIRFNVWPGDASFGGNFKASILPVKELVDWVEYSSYMDGEFTLEWREDFEASSAPAGWLMGSWSSPKNLSTHNPKNITFEDGYAVLSLTADPSDATGGTASGAGGGNSSGNAGAGGATTSGMKACDSGGCAYAPSRSTAPGWFVAALTGLAGAVVSRRGRRRAV